MLGRSVEKDLGRWNSGSGLLMEGGRVTAAELEALLPRAWACDEADIGIALPITALGLEVPLLGYAVARVGSRCCSNTFKATYVPSSRGLNLDMTYRIAVSSCMCM